MPFQRFSKQLNLPSSSAAITSQSVVTRFAWRDCGQRAIHLDTAVAF